MQNINEEELDQVIDLGLNRKGELNESALRMLGARIKLALERMFTPITAGVSKLKVKGSRKEIDSFFSALKSEKKFMDVYTKYGLDDPRTVKNAASLRRATSGFQSATGIKWPFK